MVRFIFTAIFSLYFFQIQKKNVFTDAKYYIILGAPVNFVPSYYFS